MDNGFVLRLPVSLVQCASMLTTGIRNPTTIICVLWFCTTSSSLLLANPCVHISPQSTLSVCVQKFQEGITMFNRACIIVHNDFRLWLLVGGRLKPYLPTLYVKLLHYNCAPQHSLTHSLTLRNRKSELNAYYNG